ncbi:MAG: CRTAC1 family protein [Rhodothermales bacterium]
MKLSRRNRQTLLAAVLSAAFVAIAAIGILVASRPESTYRPGEQADGVTSSLDRAVPDAYDPVTFTDVSNEAGIDFRHFHGQRSSQLPEDMGSGAAWGDYNSDGWPDLFVANLAGPITMSDEDVRDSPSHSRLYRNNGDGTFTDVSVETGVDYRGWANGAAWGDIDNDGYVDLVIAAYGELVLYQNQGDGTFSERASEMGLDGFDGFWVGASWADYDRDGLLDLYVTGYVQYEQPERQTVSRQYDTENPSSINPSSFKPERNLLFRNVNGSGFEEVGLKAGVSNPEGRSLSASWVDFDEDGWPDLYVANDVSDNALYLNQGNGTFRDASHPAWVADYRGAMGIAVGDWDGDTDMDMVVTHWIAQENALYNSRLAQDRAEGRAAGLRFVDEADAYGLGQISLDHIGWGTSFVDFDNDGRIDLYVVNGSTLQEQDDATKLGKMESRLFWNGGPDEGFYDVSSVSGDYFSERQVGRGAAYADYDGDGDVDLFIVNHGGRGVLLRNDLDGLRNWLTVRLEGRQSNRMGLGARVRVVTGGQVQVRQIGSQSTYASQNEPIAHFGLDDSEHVDTLEVIWPSGLRQVETDVPTGRRIHLVEGEPSL